MEITPFYWFPKLLLKSLSKMPQKQHEIAAQGVHDPLSGLAMSVNRKGYYIFVRGARKGYYYDPGIVHSCTHFFRLGPHFRKGC